MSLNLTPREKKLTQKTAQMQIKGHFADTFFLTSPYTRTHLHNAQPEAGEKSETKYSKSRIMYELNENDWNYLKTEWRHKQRRKSVCKRNRITHKDDNDEVTEEKRKEDEQRKRETK